jgi:LmbE family N-acetylglucosaminyl deacetylase
MDLGTVLGVWAHPDDDIYLSSGLMAANAALGNRVVDVTATRGEGGSMDHDRWPPADMARIRTDELLRSLEVLGVHEHRFLDGFVDIDMDAPLGEGTGQVAAIIADVAPDTVLTFGPEGMTGHRGHQDVSRWVGEAFGAAAPAGARLYHATYPPAWADRWLEEVAPFNIFRPGTPPITPLDQIEIALELSPDLLERKLAAIKCHESQIEGLLEVFGDAGFREFMAAEYFRFVAEKED